MENYVDLFVIGGGINGTAIAADGAGRGLSVTLCEQADLGSGTSSASSKLIHGGLRYLETYEFRMVRNAIRERRILMRKAPHLIRPLKFILPIKHSTRPTWLIRLGLFLYDYLTWNTGLPHAKRVTLQDNENANILQANIVKGFSYYDCITDDARLVVSNALAAAENGAKILTHTTCVKAEREKNHWKITLRNNLTQNEYDYYAKALVNACGPWVSITQQAIAKNLIVTELVKGSHIIVPQLYEGNFAYLLQNSDQRIIFCIPYQQNFTLIGTTDVTTHTISSSITIDEEEKQYLCDNVNQYFKHSISPKDIVWSYSGIRCLQASNASNPAKMTRDYRLEIENEMNIPLLTVIGGKLTSHRELAEHALNELSHYFPHIKPAWTANTPLPGGNLPNHDFIQFYQQFRKKYCWLPEDVAARYAQSYGTRAYQLLQSIDNLNDLGILFAAGLYQKEVEFLIQHEWASSADDILWRRTKLGLYCSESEVKQLTQWVSDYLSTGSLTNH